ncbi:MAG TPA: hypothetical protein VGM06_22185 [Polyangiaceae bacterium]
MTAQATHTTSLPHGGLSSFTPRTERVRDVDASAFDRGRLGSRALNAIELLWGRDAKRGHLLEPDAYERLRRARGIGERSIAQIERAVVAWGFDGIGGRRAFDTGGRKEWTHRNRLEAILREVGPRDMLLLLGQLCEERVASCRQKVSRRSSRLRRARSERAIVYYSVCSEYFRRCAEGAPAKAER